MSMRMIELLLAEDNEDEIILFSEALHDSRLKNLKLNFVRDGEEAIRYIRQLPPFEGRAMPDLLILDLNMPKKNGHEVLAEIKSDDQLKSLPVIILTTSQNRDDIMKSYNNHANCYISKPTDFNAFKDIILMIEDYWSRIAILPGNE